MVSRYIDIYIYILRSHEGTFLDSQLLSAERLVDVVVWRWCEGGGLGSGADRWMKTWLTSYFVLVGMRNIYASVDPFIRLFFCQRRGDTKTFQSSKIRKKNPS